MLLNDDLSVRTLVHAAALDWAPSPAKGVERRMLFRIGEEKARATSIVRYAPGSQFSRHGHPGGEEFIVLEGIFQDETGDFPAGAYVRNPPGSGHAPGSDAGCAIFVKLWQFEANDRERIVRRPGEGAEAAVHSGVKSSLLLFEGADERVMIEDWRSESEVEPTNPEGLELLVLAGGFTAGPTRRIAGAGCVCQLASRCEQGSAARALASGSSPRRSCTIMCAPSREAEISSNLGARPQARGLRT